LYREKLEREIKILTACKTCGLSHNDTFDCQAESLKHPGVPPYVHPYLGPAIYDPIFNIWTYPYQKNYEAFQNDIADKWGPLPTTVHWS
jgi:hypothetical protein